MQDIQEWLLSDRDYASGVALYARYGSSNVRKRMFATGYSSFNQEKLLESLQELIPSPAPEQVAAKPERKVTPAAPVKTISPNPEDKEQFEQLMRQRQQMLDSRTLAHARLSMVKTDAERLELALLITDLVQPIRKLNHVRKYYLHYGCLPEEAKPRPAVDETDKSALIQHRNNLRSTRSKLKKKPDKAEALAAIEEEIQRMTTLIDTYDN